MGDFGVPIAIVIMVVLDMFIEETFTEKLKVPTGVQVTLPEVRGWLINPLGQITPHPPQTFWCKNHFWRNISNTNIL